MRYDFINADYGAISSSLNCVDWNSLFQSKPLEDNIRKFNDLFLESVNLHVPSKRVVSDNTYPKWYNKELIYLISEEKKFNHILKSS